LSSGLVEKLTEQLVERKVSLLGSAMDDSSGVGTSFLVWRRALWCDGKPFGAMMCFLNVVTETFSAMTSPLVRQQAFLWCLAMSPFLVLFNNELVCAAQRRVLLCSGTPSCAAARSLRFLCSDEIFCAAQR